jgi:tartrate dehydrogenase/decarboxylase/D-malate dehydrogenase
MAYQIAIIAGDGIGTEVVPKGVRTLEALAAKYDFLVSFTSFPYSCQYYPKHGTMMPPECAGSAQII